MALGNDPIWSELGIEPTDDPADIRRAYAKRLRAVHPEDDPQGFVILRSAYEAAIERARANLLYTLEGGAGSHDAAPLFPAARNGPGAVPTQPNARPPTFDSLTIDQMLDELELDERREPELQRLRQDLARLLGPGRPDAHRVAALQRIFAAEAMESSRLYAETEAWVATLLSGNSAETEALLDPAITYFSWHDPASGRTGHYGRQAVLRRNALNMRDAFKDSSHRLHKAYQALHRPLLDSYKLQYGLTFGLRPRVAELMEQVESNRELERILDADAVRWWRKQLAGFGHGPARFWGMIVLPVLLASGASAANRPGDGSLAFFPVWLFGLIGYLIAMGCVLGVAFLARKRNDHSTAWIQSLGEEAP